MSLYAISDLHLSLGTNKSMNIFKGWDDYVSRIEKNWKDNIVDDDTVVIAGDISWAMRLEQTFNDFSFIESLPGKKIFIKGNHDYWWTTKSKIEKYLKEHSFLSISILHNSVLPAGKFCICGTRGWMPVPEVDSDLKILKRELLRLKTSVDLARKTDLEPIVFLHYPPIYGLNICQKIINILLENNIKKCYYGHIHGKNAHDNTITGNYQGIEFYLISCDYTNFSPLFIG
ncbi:MAG: metallophosphoesterase [Oscillospiraceae bacterium]|jgi:predicted phosphohydrolase|nr:metallophosphoesterase [Oscillospiraceae bacterium]